MITEDYVSFETAKLLKEKGFDEICRAFWKEWNGEISLCGCNSSHTFEYCHNTMLENYNDSEETNIAAPTFQMVIKWLREVYKLYIIVVPFPLNFEHQDIQDGWGCEVTHLSDLSYDGNYEFFQKRYPIYEQAAEAAIKYCLENYLI